MTTEQTVHPPKDFIRAKLPWIITGGFLLLYFFTLNPWLSLQSLPSVAKAGGWDWREAFSGPLFYLITLPVRLLPLSWHPHALNVFSVIFAALTLGLLTRSVSLLPHDRTREQRQRERSDFSLLTLPTAWLPPLLAAIVFGLQLTVWQHATVASEEILNVLLFAYIIRCLLEYRVGERESWLYRMAFVYGLAITNNFAMIGFFPLFLAALIWIRGRAFFNFRFLVRSSLLGVAGLSLYLLLPLIHAASADSGLSFLDALRSNWNFQRMALSFGLSQRFLILMAALTSILPIFIIGIRWPSSFGDISAAGSMLTTLMFRVIHLMFLAICLYIFFDPPISGRGVGLPYMPMLTFYYLAALAVGYFSGYALLVYGKPPAKAWQRPSPAIQLLNHAVIGLVFLSAIGVIAGLAYRNLPRLRAENSDLLRQYTGLMRDSLPDTPAIILSDNPYQLYLLQAGLGGASSQNDHLLVDTSSLQNPHYQRHLHSTRPERWSVPLQAAPNATRIEQLIVLTNMIDLAASNDLYYLHPSFGYFFEYFRLEPRGGVYRMRTFETNSILAPPPDPALIETNQQFWAAARQPMELTLSHLGLGSIDAGWLGTNFSRSLNFWGVELQRANRLEEAATCFELAGRLNTNNVVAHINRDYNANLQRGSTAPINPDASLENKFSRFRTWESVLAVNGPFDEPDFCLELGKIFARGNNYRQALQQFHRALDLKPDSLATKMWITFTYSRAQRPDQVLEWVANIRAASHREPLKPS
ncbi:MAG TPA: DUF2723 domain-containing protein, partial [Methylomirabilota bacterium]|nr:DUF2723 domain-containing protein [Methylomirabilota bacterium]